MLKYLTAVVLFAVACLLGLVLEPSATIGAVLYLVGLFAICATPLFVRNPFFGRYTLYTIFLLYAFFAYGMHQFLDLILPLTTAPLIPREGLFATSEPVILLGLASFVVGYRATMAAVPGTARGLFRREWRPRLATTLGVIFWIFGAFVTVNWKFAATGDFDSRIGELGLFGGVVSNLRNFMLLGEFILVYGYLSSRTRATGVVMLAVMLINIALGLITDQKETGFRMFVSFLLASLLVEGRVRPAQVGAVLVIIVIGFAGFSEYRTFLQERHLTIESSFEDFDRNIDKAFSGERSFTEVWQKGIAYFMTRVSLNGSTEMVTANVGDAVPFRRGNTLTPLLYAPIPRFLYPDKPDSNVGRQINREFRVSASSKTYISIGQLAEFYWNFGLVGVAIGMAGIGVLFAVISLLIDMSVVRSMPRFLLLLATIYLLVLRFEGGFAVYYTVWLRIIGMIIVLHLLIPKTQRSSAPRDRDRADTGAVSDVGPGSAFLRMQV